MEKRENFYMTDLLKTTNNLEKRGYIVNTFETAAEASEYLDKSIDGMSVGIGGSFTIESMNLYDKLKSHNVIHWHWKQEPERAKKGAMSADIYLTSANALAETGEIINIDGVGNRIASTLFGHKKIYFIIGKNKLAKNYEEALWRARNVAGPGRAKQLNKNTPCTIKGDRCYDCNSEDRICRGMATLWAPMSGMEAEVILINESLGL